MSFTCCWISPFFLYLFLEKVLTWTYCLDSDTQDEPNISTRKTQMPSYTFSWASAYKVIFIILSFRSLKAEKILRQVSTGSIDERFRLTTCFKTSSVIVISILSLHSWTDLDVDPTMKRTFKTALLSVQEQIKTSSSFSYSLKR